MLFPTILTSSLLMLSGLVAAQSTITITRTVDTVIIVEPPTSTGSTLTTKTSAPTTKKTTSTSSVKPPTTIKTSTKATTSSKAQVTQTIYTTVTVTSVATTKATTTAKPTLTTAPDPNLTKCPMPLYYQCGGSRSYNGCTKCVAGASCVSQNVDNLTNMVESQSAEAFSEDP
ncbi:carbohydrate-binding module family 1 protein [Cadophora sp. DSE1049]|nr:carbohydrate-binding module family 1 protein [Cadophora sp. DSE1049]